MRACFMSGCTRTSLATTVTSSRGSFSSPASMALISCAISSATRSWRWFVELISVLLPHFLDDLHCLIDQERAEDAVRLAQYFLQHFVHVLLFIRNRHHTYHRSLPGVVMLQFRHGDVEIAPQLVFQAAQDLAFVLQRLGVGNVQLEGEQADWHLRSGESLSGLFLAG